MQDAGPRGLEVERSHANRNISNTSNGWSRLQRQRSSQKTLEDSVSLLIVSFLPH
jgi:hypothetical protein